MDNFIDKLAQKFTAGEVIRANSVAEEREWKRLKEQVAEYEKCLQELRRMQMRNTQTAQNLQELMEESKKSFHKITQESLLKIKEVQGTATQQDAEMKNSLITAKEAVVGVEEEARKMTQAVENVTQLLEKNQQEIEQWFHQADDYLHKENVKVYRNVQAVVVEEIGSKTENIVKLQESHAKKFFKPAMIFAVLAFLMATADVVIQLLNIYGMM